MYRCYPKRFEVGGWAFPGFLVESSYVTRWEAGDRLDRVGNDSTKLTFREEPGSLHATLGGLNRGKWVSSGFLLVGKSPGEYDRQLGGYGIASV